MLFQWKVTIEHHFRYGHEPDYRIQHELFPQQGGRRIPPSGPPLQRLQRPLVYRHAKFYRFLQAILVYKGIPGDTADGGQMLQGQDHDAHNIRG